MFENLIGNDNIKVMLQNAVDNGNTSHSYLFLGIQGIGKKEFAIELAKTLLCSNNNKCNKCKSCLEFETNNHPDFFYIQPDDKNIKIEQIRNIQKEIQQKPIISSKKVFIFNSADTMTKEAQNCLLKTLEEPPEFATIILIGSNENTFLNTIKSRCTILYFNRIKDEEIKTYLEANKKIDNVTQNILDIAQGSIGKALEIKDKQEQYEDLKNVLDQLDKINQIDLVKQSEIIYKNKEEIQDILDYINIILLKKAKSNYLYTNCIKIVENTKKRLKQNANYDMCIDNMLFNMWEELN